MECMNDTSEQCPRDEDLRWKELLMSFPQRPYAKGGNGLDEDNRYGLRRARSREVMHSGACFSHMRKVRSPGMKLYDGAAS